jgi:hypothetical protein
VIPTVFGIVPVAAVRVRRFSVWTDCASSHAGVMCHSTERGRAPQTDFLALKISGLPSGHSLGTAEPSRRVATALASASFAGPGSGFGSSLAGGGS